MKKRINGKIYDTDTADRIASWDNGRNGTDFDYVWKVLYQKRDGEFFLYAEGGPRTIYSKLVRDGWVSGAEVIEPMTVDEAKSFAKGLISDEEFNAVFNK